MLAQYAQALLAPIVTVQLRVSDDGIQFLQSRGRRLHLRFDFAQPCFQRFAQRRALLPQFSFKPSLRAPVYCSIALSLGITLIAFETPYPAATLSQPAAVIFQVTIEFLHSAVRHDPEAVHRRAQEMAIMRHEQHAAAELR